MDMKYEDYKKMIMKIAHSYNKTTGMNVEDLISEGNLVFVERLKNFDPEKSKFSTFLYESINARFKNLNKRQHLQKYDGVKVEVDMANKQESGDNIENNCILKNSIEILSKDAKMVVSIVLNAPADLLSMLPKPSLSRFQLTTYLLKLGWKKKEINKSYKEIQNAIS